MRYIHAICHEHITTANSQSFPQECTPNRCIRNSHDFTPCVISPSMRDVSYQLSLQDVPIFIACTTFESVIRKNSCNSNIYWPRLRILVTYQLQKKQCTSVSMFPRKTRRWWRVGYLTESSCDVKRRVQRLVKRRVVKRLVQSVTETEMSPFHTTPVALLDDFNSISSYCDADSRSLSSCELAIMPFNFSSLSSATNESRRQP